jgi:hypothetical protein
MHRAARGKDVPAACRRAYGRTSYREGCFRAHLGMARLNGLNFLLLLRALLPREQRLPYCATNICEVLIRVSVLIDTNGMLGVYLYVTVVFTWFPCVLQVSLVPQAAPALLKYVSFPGGAAGSRLI